jgi:DNA-binding transcriptional MerR regulator
MEKQLPAIPAKRYFTIGEVSELCGVKPYVLRYWEQEFTQLKPMKRRGNRRYYQHHEVLLIRRIRELLYDQGFTISGARNRLADAGALARAAGPGAEHEADEHTPSIIEGAAAMLLMHPAADRIAVPVPTSTTAAVAPRALALPLPSETALLRSELLSIRELLSL